MFDDLPATNPPRNKKKPRAIVAAALVHVVLVTAIIVVQMAMPAKLGELHVLTTLYMAPPPPPPPPPAPAGPPPKMKATPKQTGSAASEPVVQPMPPKPTVQEPELIAPTEIPRDVARILDVGPAGGGVIGGIPGGVPGGVPGGTPGGIPGGVLGGIGANAPPPAPPQAPVRVGGDVRQPKLIKIVEPKYPDAAKKARVEGSVILEATVTENGNIERLKVISGPQMLVQAAIEAVQQWKYEPTYLNGKPVAVILTAKVNFALEK